MLPHETSSDIPKTVLRYIWSIKVLKAGLSNETGQTEEQVRLFFDRNPHLHSEFAAMNNELIAKISELQQRAIAGLRYECMKQSINPFFDTSRKRIKINYEDSIDEDESSSTF